MAIIAHRRVHLGVRAKLAVTVGRHEREMMRRHLNARPSLVIYEKADLCRRGNMQNVNALLVFLGKCHELLGRNQRRLFIAPLGMRGRVACAAQTAWK